jgi:hypothetical protein
VPLRSIVKPVDSSTLFVATSSRSTECSSSFTKRQTENRTLCVCIHSDFLHRVNPVLTHLLLLETRSLSIISLEKSMQDPENQSRIFETVLSSSRKRTTTMVTDSTDLSSAYVLESHFLSGVHGLRLTSSSTTFQEEKPHDRTRKPGQRWAVTPGTKIKTVDL